MHVNVPHKNFNLEDVKANPQVFLLQLFDAAVRRAMPLHNTQAFLPAPELAKQAVRWHTLSRLCGR